MPGPIAAIAGASLVGGVAQASSARSASRAQQAAADRDIAFQRETRDMIREDLSPFRGAGGQGLDAYMFNMGLGPRPDGYTGFQATPGYQFQMDQGTQAVNAMAGARGGLNSGRTLQDLSRFGQGLANQEFGGYMNRLAGLTDMGMGAAGMQANASQNAAAGMSNALAARGNAQAAGAIGMGNAISGGINNALGGWAYMRHLNTPGSMAPRGVPGVGLW